ncbi:GntR family transcriptional regulator [Microbacterium paraoxydans]|uniref:GntR family transcriptional regulator n=2 Tax=Microbacterium paraoxydans TaxID=199592 RepID=A0ABS5II41_9MICO|nr:GntR family transcriptional regulator [Microbacterium paraoxydans]
MSDDIYNRLRDAIVSGELRPGERLRDYELAETLGTSKTPVRHALDRLAEHGLVEMQRNRFTRVAPIDLDDVRDAVALFGDVWIGSVRHATPLMRDDDVTYLSELIEDMQSAIAASDVAAFSAALRTIAVAYARIEGNTTRSTVIEFLGPQIRRFSAQARGDFDFTALAASTREIQTAMTQRDAVGQRAALIALFDRVLPAVIDRAEERGRRVGAEQLDA